MNQVKSLPHVRLADILSDAYSVFRWRLIALFVLMIVGALFEGLGMALLLPLLQAVGLGNAMGSQNIVAKLVGQTPAAQSIGMALLLVVGAQLLQGMIQITQNWWIAKMQRQYGAHWQHKLTRALLHARWIFFSSQKQGELTNTIAYETIRLAGAFQVFAQVVATTVVALAYLILACFLSLPLTLSLFVFAATLFVLLRRISKRNYRIGLTLGPLQSELTVLLSETFGSSKLIKATSTESFVERKLGGLFEALRRAHTLATFLPSLTRSLFEFVSLSALCCLLVVGYKWLELPAAIMLLILGLFVRLLPRANAFLQNLQLIATYLPALAGVRHLWHQATASSEGDPTPSTVTWPAAPVNIEIVRAEYDGKPALTDVHLQLPEKGFIGIVGPSGSGKTTLLNCLLGLVPIKEGGMRIGDLHFSSDTLAAWRSGMSLVPQDSQLFHLSIAQNIAWGDETPDMNRVHHAAQKAQAHDFILSQPQGYETIIGDQGMRLSGGQRQRLGIARALYRNPRLLLLDEATSALDSTTETAVLATVEQLRDEMCVVSIAHRLISVRQADKIIVLDQGRIVEHGTWEQLVAARGLFHSLATAQQVA